MLLLLGLLSTANAEKPTYYHPDDVAQASELFRSASARIGPDFEQAQAELSRLGQQLEQMELGVSLLGERTPDAMQTWSTQTQRTVTGQYIRIQRHVDLLQEDFGQTFGDALQRALSATAGGADAKECTAGGGGISAMMRRGSLSDSSCEGENLNAALAKRMDKDAALKTALDEIYGIPYPELGIEPVEQPSVSLTGSGSYIQLGVVAKRFINTRLQARKDGLEDALAPLSRKLEANDEAAVQEATRLKDQYTRTLAADGAELIAAMEASLTKGAKKDAALGDVALCANPEGLGGCAGEDVTRAVVQYLHNDRRFQKYLSRL